MQFKIHKCQLHILQLSVKLTTFHENYIHAIADCRDAIVCIDFSMARPTVKPERLFCYECVKQTTTKAKHPEEAKTISYTMFV